MAILKYRFYLHHVTGLQQPVDNSITDKPVKAIQFSKNLLTETRGKRILKGSCFWNNSGNSSVKWNENKLNSSNERQSGHWHLNCQGVFQSLAL